jgi:hypothetical protein
MIAAHFERYANPNQFIEERSPLENQNKIQSEPIQPQAATIDSQFIKNRTRIFRCEALFQFMKENPESESEDLKPSFQNPNRIP